MEYIKTNKGTAIVTDRNRYMEQEEFCGCCGNQTSPATEVEEVYYQDILNKDHKINTTVKDGKLFIGDKEVTGYDHKIFGGHVPRHLTIRKLDDSVSRPWARFVSGFDLLDDGRYWLAIGDENYKYYDTFKEVNDFLISQGHEGYGIYTEEDFIA